jgi:hypothetical protein
MAQPISTQQEMDSATRTSGGPASLLVVAAAAVGAAVLLGAGALWFHYGTAVFFEMISSGIASCF